jgi:hypothetical protein
VLVGVAHDEPDGTTCRFPLKDPTQQFYPVWFLTRGRDLTLSRSATVKFLLDEFQVDINPCGHPIHDTPYGFSMALAK